MHPSPTRRRAVRVAALLLLAACGRTSSTGAQPAPSQTRDSAGITIVTSADAPGEQWVIEDEPLVRIQEDDTLIYVSSVRLRHGFVLVDASSAMELRFYDAQGRFVSRAGGQGEGRGQFESIGWVQALSPDSVAVWDPFGRRLNVFTADGRLARTMDASGLDRVRLPSVHGMFRDGSLLVSAKPADRDPPVGTVWRDTATFLRVSPAGEVLDTVGAFATEEQFQLAAMGDLRAHSRWVPLGLRLVSAAGGETFWIGTGPSYELRQFRADGTLVRIARVDRPPRPLPAGVRELYLRENVPAPADETVIPFWTRFVGQAPFPRTAAPFVHLSAGPGGRLWVHRAHTPDEPPHGVIADLLNAEGRLIGTVSGERRFRVQQVGPDWVLGQVQERSGHTRVEVRRLARR